MKTILGFLVRSLCVMAIVGVLGLPDAASAANKNKRKNRRQVILKGAASELQKVTSVGKDSLRVGDKYYEVREDADIIVNGKKASLNQVKKGMQASVSARVLSYGRSGKETTYQATRIVARTDNELAKKAAEHNKKVLQQARRRNHNRNRRR